jgi:hypothetical protein
MIYGFEAAFFSSNFSKRLSSVFGLVQLLFSVVDFFHLRFALINPGPFCASVVDLLFQVSQRRFIYITYIYIRERESLVLLAPESEGTFCAFFPSSSLGPQCQTPGHH